MREIFHREAGTSAQSQRICPSAKIPPYGGSMPFAKIPEVLAALRAGHMIVLVDDEDRENEGALVCAAHFVTPKKVNFMLREARGVLCAPFPEEACPRLDLYPQTTQNTAP